MLKRLLLYIFPVLLLLAGCCAPASETEEYTLRLPLPRSPSCWNPHTRKAEEDLFPSSFCEMGFVRPDYTDASPGWVYEMALSIEDITEDFSERTSLGISDTEGRVFLISLNPDAVWEDGTPILADSYLQSMQFLLDPQRKNSGALPFLDGPAALLYADEYARNGTPQYVPVVPYSDFSVPAEYPNDLSGQEIYLHLTTHSMTLSRTYSIEDLLHLGFVEEDLYRSLEQQADPSGYIRVTEDNAEEVQTLAHDVLAYFGLQFNEDSFSEMLFRRTGENWPEVSFSKVGLRKTGAYELIYITESVISLDDFLGFMTDNWLVYPALYESDPQLYGTSVQTYRSYGPYRLENIAEDGTVTLIRNASWYGYSGTPNDKAPAPTRIQFVITDEDNALSLWERGLLDLCFTDESDYAAQVYRSFLQNCNVCGRSFLLSPRLNPPAHPCWGNSSSMYACTFLYSDAQWEIYRSERNGYAVLPSIQKTP